MNPVFIRTSLRILGGACMAVAAVDHISWQTVVAALGTYFVGWMQTAPNHVAIDHLPLAVQESVRPPAP